MSHPTPEERLAALARLVRGQVALCQMLHGCPPDQVRLVLMFPGRDGSRSAGSFDAVAFVDDLEALLSRLRELHEGGEP